MAYSINLTDAQKTEVSKLIAESASTDDTHTAWITGHLNTVLEISMHFPLILSALSSTRRRKEGQTHRGVISKFSWLRGPHFQISG